MFCFFLFTARNFHEPDLNSKLGVMQKDLTNVGRNHRNDYDSLSPLLERTVHNHK